MNQAIPAMQPSSADRLRAKQAAMSNVVDTQEKLQEAWNAPVTVRVAPTKVALLVLIVSVDEGEFSWNASVRLKHHKKSKLKAVASWTPDERASMAALLDTVLEGCGKKGDQSPDVEAEASTWALHINRPVTPSEKGFILRPGLLGSAGSGDAS